MVEIIKNDDFGLYGAIPYIYTNGYNWFILHWKSEQKAIDNCPNDYSCNPYRTTKQIP